VLALEDLHIALPPGSDRLEAVCGLNLEVLRGEVLCLVGESGSGKSVIAQAVMGLLAKSLRVISGSIRLEGEELTRATQRRLRALRTTRMSMIFQEPMTALNPVMRCGEQIDEVLRAHTDLAEGARRTRILEMIDEVAIPDPERIFASYPYQLSGGQRQRIMIAMALVLDPALLIADEPTTALDVTIQAQILRLMRDLQARLGMAIVMITHDLGVVAEMAHRVVVMYAGRKVEEGPIAEIFARPRHPYTVGLMRSRPRLGGSLAGTARARLAELPGQVPSLRDLALPGCAFAPRCALAEPRCRASAPPIAPVGPRHLSACWRAAEVEALVSGGGT